MSRFLIVVGILCILAGFGWHWLARIPFGQLPGDIHIVRDGFNFHFPIVTSIIVSLLLTLLMMFLGRR